jgi:2-polyprenyl-3-methyl-5-hydroxy-6-metoxy-1,4-benzoquinol methylase
MRLPGNRKGPRKCGVRENTDIFLKSPFFSQMSLRGNLKMTPEERLKRKNKFDGNLVMGSRQFNQITGRDAHLEKIKRKKAQLVNPITGLLHEELSLPRSCPICNSDKETLIFIKEGFRHVKCGLCGMFYVSPVFKKDKLQSFYLEESSWTKILLNETQQSLDRKRFQYGLDLIEEYLPQKGKLIDVGCGPGVFLLESLSREWQVQGIEFNQWCIQHLSTLNIDVIDTPLDQAELLPDSYQCVTLWDILEHIIDLKEFLRKCYQILIPRGIILIQVPNIDSMVSRILHEKSATFSGDVHVNFFNVATLTMLLEQTGFVIKECETIWTEIDTINNYLNFEDPYFGEGKNFFDFLTPEYIHGRMLGSRLLALAEASK